MSINSLIKCKICGEYKDKKFFWVMSSYRKLTNSIKKTKRNFCSDCEKEKFAYSRKRNDAKKRGLSFELTKKEFENILKSDICYYCGKTLEECMSIFYKILKSDMRHILLVNKRTIKVRKKFSIDRKDSFQGYTSDNCVASCRVCNLVKNRYVPSYIYKKIANEVMEYILKRLKC